MDEITDITADLNIVYTTREFQVDNDRFDDKIWKFVGTSIVDRNDKNDIPFNEIKNKIICIKNLQYELNLKIDDVKYKTSYNAYTLFMNEYKEVLFFINMSELDQDDKEFINNNFNEIRFI